MARLDTQRRPSKVHARPNVRKYARGYDTVPHETWGESIAGGATYAPTTAYAGNPGSFAPDGATVPANAAAITTLVASPKTAWTTGQHVQSATAGATGRAYWNGTAWVTGAAAP